MAGDAAQDEQVGKDVDDVRGLELAGHSDGQALVGELVHHVEHPEPAPIVRPVLDEVVGPDVVRTFWSQTDTGAAGQPQPSPLGLLGGHLQPLAPPDALHPLGVHQPACLPQEGGDLAVAVAPVLARQRDDVGREPLLVVSPPQRPALRRAMLTERAGRARRPEMFSFRSMCSTHARRRAGPRSFAGADLRFPGRPRSGSACRA